MYLLYYKEEKVSIFIPEDCRDGRQRKIKQGEEGKKYGDRVEIQRQEKKRRNERKNN